MNGEARTAVLGRVRAALRESRPEDRARSAAASWAALPRTYAQTAQLSREACLLLLMDRLRDYDAVVSRVREADVGEGVAAALSRRGNLPTLLPPGFPASWCPAQSSLVLDIGFTPGELDRFDGVITAATLAIAETGTLVLQSVPGQGRRAATLVPDFHLCVVRAQDAVETVPQALAKLAATKELPTTFISGPSATADIEMTRIKGVHGPRFLEVLLVE